MSFARPVLNAKDHMRVSSRNCPPEKQDSLWPADFTHCHSVTFSVAGKLAGTIYPLTSPLPPQISNKRAGKDSSVEVKSAQGKEAQ